MIILDTNVFSALMQEERRSDIVRWLNRTDIGQLFTTSITVMEVRNGIEILAVGKKQQYLDAKFHEVLRDHLNSRVLAFDRSAAEKTASILALARSAGKSIELRDAQIAGVVTSQEAILATRNTRHFQDHLLFWQLVDPWAEAADT